MARHTYTVEYVCGVHNKKVDVIAGNKWDAYMKAVYEVIPEREGELPYSAWVDSVTYQNGNCKHFNTFAGKPV